VLQFFPPLFPPSLSLLYFPCLLAEKNVKKNMALYLFSACLLTLQVWVIWIISEESRQFLPERLVKFDISVHIILQIFHLLIFLKLHTWDCSVWESLCLLLQPIIYLVICVIFYIFLYLLYLPNLSFPWSRSHITTDGQSARSSWCLAPFGVGDQMLYLFEWQLLSLFFT
jgi:hypothetical protein